MPGMPGRLGLIPSAEQSLEQYRRRSAQQQSGGQHDRVSRTVCRLPIRSGRQAISEQSTDKQSEPVHDGQQGAMPAAARRRPAPPSRQQNPETTMQHDRASVETTPTTA
jgi:hypothetical protein